jgi:hypothetical protein
MPIFFYSNKFQQANAFAKTSMDEATFEQAASMGRRIPQHLTPSKGATASKRLLQGWPWQWDWPGA